MYLLVDKDKNQKATREKTDSNSSSVSEQPVKIKLPDIVTKKNL